MRLYFPLNRALEMVNGRDCCQRIVAVVPNRRLATAPEPVKKALLRKLIA